MSSARHDFTLFPLVDKDIARFDFNVAEDLEVSAFDKIAKIFENPHQRFLNSIRILYNILCPDDPAEIHKVRGYLSAVSASQVWNFCVAFGPSDAHLEKRLEEEKLYLQKLSREYRPRILMFICMAYHQIQDNPDKVRELNQSFDKEKQVDSSVDSSMDVDSDDLGDQEVRSMNEADPKEILNSLIRLCTREYKDQQDRPKP